MGRWILKILIVSWMGLVGVPILAFIGTAHGKTIETFHEEFRSNTGKEWIDATAEEKRSFVQDYYHKKEETVREGRERLYYGSEEDGSGAPLSIESTLEIQHLFKRKQKKSWGEATSEEQKAFLTEYGKEHQKELERRRIQEERDAQEEEKRRQLEEQEKERLKHLEEQKVLEKVRAKELREKEREQSREKLMNALEKFRAKRPNTQGRRR